MANRMRINVTNLSRGLQQFYLFQQPATFSGGSRVYSANLSSGGALNYDTSGAVLTFDISAQPYACVQLAHGEPTIGQMSGYASASRAIDLSPGQDWTTASVEPLGLTHPRQGMGITPQAFRITTPAFQPSTRINVGAAVEVDGGLVLSSFIKGEPHYNVDCQPSQKFFIQTGSFQPAAVINFNQASVNAAVCDFTSGFTALDVRYNADGTWRVSAR